MRCKSQEAPKGAPRRGGEHQLGWVEQPTSLDAARAANANELAAWSVTNGGRPAATLL